MADHRYESVPYKGWSIQNYGDNGKHPDGPWEAMNKETGEILGALSYDGLKEKVDNAEQDYKDALEGRGHWYTR